MIIKAKNKDVKFCKYCRNKMCDMKKECLSKMIKILKKYPTNHIEKIKYSKYLEKKFNITMGKMWNKLLTKEKLNESTKSLP